MPIRSPDDHLAGVVQLLFWLSIGLAMALAGLGWVRLWLRAHPKVLGYVLRALVLALILSASGQLVWMREYSLGATLGLTWLIILVRWRQYFTLPEPTKAGAGAAGAGNRQNKRSGGGQVLGMTRAQALATLGLQAPASEGQIRLAHRQLMLTHHPDHGGNDQTAAKINQAKDFLLGK
jgi:hypothetical protein